jgi:hypothetical protein
MPLTSSLTRSLGIFDKQGWVAINESLQFIHIVAQPPTHNYSLAASILLKTINVNAATIKRWAILDSGATSHLLTTNTPATNIVLAAVPLIAYLPNSDKVQSTHTCTLDLPDLPAGVQVAHIIPG